MYRDSPCELLLTKKYLEELLELGAIQLSSLPWGVPKLFAKKPDG